MNAMKSISPALTWPFMLAMAVIVVASNFLVQFPVQMNLGSIQLTVC